MNPSESASQVQPTPSIRDLPQRAVRLMGVIVGKETAASIATRLAADSIGTYLLRVLSALFSLAIGAAFARMLDVDGYGAYTYAIAWASSLHVLTACGLDRLLIRNVASYAARAEWSPLRGLLQWSARTAFWISIVTVVVVGYAATHFFHQDDRRLLPAFWLGLFLVPALTLNVLRQAAMQGLHQVIPGQMPDRVLQPLLIAGLIALAYFFHGTTLQPPWAVAITGLGMLSSCVVGLVYFFRALPPGVLQAAPAPLSPDWKTGAYTLAWVSWATIATDQADTLLLGLLGGVDDVGIYSVGIRGVRVISFSLIAVNTALAPTAAQLFAMGETDRLHRVAVRSSRVVLFIALPLAVGLILFRKYYLGLFGPAFVEGERVLLVLVCGQLLNAAAGPGGLLLIATGHERNVAYVTALGAIVQLVLCVVLIPPFGVIGAAISRVSTIACLNLTLAVLVRRRIGINCFAFAPLPRRASVP